MKNLFAHLAQPEVSAVGIPRLKLTTQTNDAIDAILNSALSSGYPQEKEGRPSSINTLAHMRYVQDESADFSRVAEECALVFMPDGSDGLIANISEWDDYFVEMRSWQKRVPGCNFALHPTLRTLSSDSGFFVFEHETPYEFQYSLDGNYPHDIYVAFIFKKWVLAVKHRNR